MILYLRQLIRLDYQLLVLIFINRFSSLLKYIIHGLNKRRMFPVGKFQNSVDNVSATQRSHKLKAVSTACGTKFVLVQQNCSMSINCLI